MLVRDWMSQPVVAVGVEDTMQRAIELMKDYDIGMLPVMDGGRLVGIVTDRDLKRAAPSDAAVFEVRQVLYHLSRVQMGAIMSRKPVTVRYDHTVEEAAQTLLDRKISGCPVMDTSGQVVGIITKSDIFRAIVSVTGLLKRGLQFGVTLEDRPGSIKEVTDVVRSYGGRLVSILTSYDNAPKGSRRAYIRAFGFDRDRLPQLKQLLRDKMKLIYMIDHRIDEREIYNNAKDAAK
ncbi:MAG: CBS and ACT domain-containing protein [Desulfomonilaceae bacterium]|nr:CBS and ACT domain-containing protein [Desulfomonilaceae bacterium]